MYLGDTAADCPEVPESELKTPVQETESKDLVDFKVVFNKKKYDVSFPLDETIAKLKTHIQEITGKKHCFIVIHGL